MWQVITILLLLALMIGLQQFQLELPNTPFNPKSLAATGFIILAAFTTGELFRKFKIPALLGFIAAGIVFGPSLASILFSPDMGAMLHAEMWPTWASALFAPGDKALFDKSVIADLALINVLTVGVIGTMGGGELKLSDIKESWRLILLIITLIIFSAIPLTLGTVLGLSYLPLGLTSFLENETLLSRVAAGLLFAILAVAMSPAATLAIIQETRAKGRFTSLVLGVVVVADLALVALFLVGFSFAKLLVAPGGFKIDALLHALPHIAMEFGWALIVGAVTGAVLILYMRFVRREMMLFTVAVIFATSYVCTMLHAETLLAFLTAGFIVQNFSRFGHALIHELEKISAPVFIIYFMTQAAQLDLKPVLAFLPLTLILAFVRGAAFYGSIKIATTVSTTSDATKQNLWMTFFSRGGVDLVLAAMVAKAVTAAGTPVFAWGVSFQTVIMSTVVVHIIAGPPLLKFALTRAGETEESAGETEESATAGPSGIGEVELPAPAFDNRYLNEHVEALRDALNTLHHDQMVGPQRRRAAELNENLDSAHAASASALRQLGLLLGEERGESTAVTLRSVRALHRQYHQQLQPIIMQWERHAPLACDTDHIASMLIRVQELERFDALHVVEMEDVFFDASASESRMVRTLRRMRRFQRAVAGPGQRVIPVGKLWRYHVELALPGHLATAAEHARAEHEQFWFRLGRYLRLVDALFQEVMRTLEGVIHVAAPELGEEEHDAHDAHGDHGHDGDHDGHDGHDEHGHDDHGHDDHAREQIQRTRELIQSLVLDLSTEDTPRARARALVALARDVIEEAMEEVRQSLDASMEASTQGYAWSLSESFGAFLGGVARAGTWELPAYRYRASARFDQARRAQLRLAQVLDREVEVVSGYVGWIVMDHQLALFSVWYQRYQQRISDTLRTLFRDRTARQFERLEGQCAKKVAELAPPEPAPEPEPLVVKETVLEATAAMSAESEESEANAAEEAAEEAEEAEEAVAEASAGEVVEGDTGADEGVTEAVVEASSDASSEVSSEEAKATTRPKPQAALEPPTPSIVLARKPVVTDDAPRPLPQLTPAAGEIDWAVWLRREVRPVVRSSRRALERALISFGQGIDSRQLIDELEKNVASFSEELTFLLHDPDVTAPADASLETIRLRTRQWFSRKLVNAIALSYMEFNEEAERLVRRNLVALSEVEQRLEVGLLVEDELPGERAQRVLSEVEALLQDVQHALMMSVEELEENILNQTALYLERSSGPFLHYRLADVQREALRLASPEAREDGWAARRLTPLMEDLRRIVGLLRPLYGELRDDVREHLTEHEAPMRHVQHRAQLRVGAEDRIGALPPIYRRLFNPVPLDLPEFYVARPALERACLDVIASWGKGRAASLLLYGDPGVGKRTFAHNLIPIKIYDLAPNFRDVPIQTVRLNEEIEREADLCANLGTLLGREVDSFEGLESLLMSGSTRRIVLVENAARCFRRTPEGMAMCRSFLDLISATSQRVFWVMMLETPSAVLMDTTLGLFSYFTHVFEVEAMDAEELERMILNRHRVSGFSVSFRPEQSNTLERLRHPLRTYEAQAQPDRVFFARLAEHSGGNPLLALLWWMDSLEVSLTDDRALFVSPLGPPTRSLVDGLSLEKLLLIAALLQHGALSPAQLSTLLLIPREEVQTELGHLERLGFVERFAGTEEQLRLRSVAAPQAAQALRRRNLV